MAPLSAEDAATPIMRLAVETMESSDPSTKARNHAARPLLCTSPWGTNHLRFKDHLQRFRLGGIGEGLIRREDAVELEAMGHQESGIELS